MMSKQEIKEMLEKCKKVWDYGMSKGPCPFENENRKGCCAECSTPSTLAWVLGGSNNPSHNAQDILIEKFK